ncbi:hypothetical protein Nepgr_016463 [Nepenthes gracilis]|uniref:Uncharacterized protein n=1 Tax=Nepenthes gracilis TaxID=150966 RepID=A0AAD3XRC5_NEPGR|nr:hypothetical protein Nepgr_016463 [Nepenthes gracilis]
MSSKIVEVEVDYQWKPARHVSGCTANQSSHERAYNGMKAEQIAKPKNLAPGVDWVGSGTTSLDSHSADHKTLSVKLRPEIEQSSCQTFGFDAHSLESVMDNQEERLSAVGMTEACHVAPMSKDYLAEGDHSLPSQDLAIDEQMVLASGIFGGIEAPSSVRELTVKAQEVTCVAPVDNSTSRLGLDSQSPLDDAVTTTVLVDGYLDASSIGVPTEAKMDDTPAVGSTLSSHAAPADHHAIGVDLDLTPNSMTQLLSKYSLDDLVHVEPISVSPRGSLHGGWEDWAQDAPREGIPSTDSEAQAIAAKLSFLLSAFDEVKSERAAKCRGTLPSMEGLNAFDNSQNVFLGKAVISASKQESSDAIHKVPLELAMPSEFAKEDPTSMESMNFGYAETNTNGCMTLIGSGDGDLKDNVQRSDLPVRAVEESAALLVQQLLDRMGPNP